MYKIVFLDLSKNKLLTHGEFSTKALAAGVAKALSEKYKIVCRVFRAVKVDATPCKVGEGPGHTITQGKDFYMLLGEGEVFSFDSDKGAIIHSEGILYCLDMRRTNYEKAVFKSADGKKLDRQLHDVELCSSPCTVYGVQY
jgi:hypothetical protein